MQRKNPQGELRNKDKTIEKLISAVGDIIRTGGYTGLGVNNIAKNAGVDKKLIYVYFESVDNLIETYVKKKDYWVSFSDKLRSLIKDHQKDFGEELASGILKNQFESFYQDKEMQQIIRWEISTESKLMNEISSARELLDSEFFKMTDPHFAGTDIDLRAIEALQIAGIYYLVLHSQSNNSTFCEIDINDAQGRSRIIKALDNIIKWTYREAEKQR